MKYNFSDTLQHCQYTMRIFPSADFADPYTSNKPVLYTVVVVLVFMCTALAFVLYDHFVQVRQVKVAAVAKQTNAIVASLFPSNVRDRILKDAEMQAQQELDAQGRGDFKFDAAAKTQLKTFLDGNESGEGGDPDNHDSSVFATKPIADLFPSATIMFADIVSPAFFHNFHYF